MTRCRRGARAGSPSPPTTPASPPSCSRVASPPAPPPVPSPYLRHDRDGGRPQAATAAAARVDAIQAATAAAARVDAIQAATTTAARVDAVHLPRRTGEEQREGKGVHSSSPRLTCPMCRLQAGPTSYGKRQRSSRDEPPRLSSNRISKRASAKRRPRKAVTRIHIESLMFATNCNDTSRPRMYGTIQTATRD
jgi:hypothetical protein